jgi:magnesium transporter
VSGFRIVGREIERITPRTTEEVVAHVRSPEFVWLNLDLQNAPVAEVVELLENRLDFHPLVVEECVTPDVYQPKVEEESGYKFFIFHYFREGRKDHLKASEVNVYLGENFVMTLHRSAIPTYLKQFAQDLPEDIFVFRDKPIIFLYHILDVLIDDYLRTLKLIQNRGDEIEFSMLAPSDLPVPLSKEQRLRLRKLRKRDQLAIMKEIIAQRHNLALMRKSLQMELAILREQVEEYEKPPEPLPIPDEEREEVVVYLGGLVNHLEQALQIIEQEREILNQILELHSIVLNTRSNEVMRVLTVFAAIFIPLTFVASFYGMNLKELHGASWGSFIWLLDALMLALAGGMLYYFYRKDWL